MNLKGAALLLGGAFFFSLMSVLVKLGGETMPSPMLVLARAIVTLVLSLGWVWQRGVSPFGEQPKLLLARGLLGFGGLLCFFTAVTMLPLAEVTVIHYLNPVLTAALGWLLLKERVSRFLVVALVLGVAGVALVARPTGLIGGTLPPLGVAAALAGAVFASGAYVMVRRLKGEDPLVVVLYFSFVAVPLSLPFAIPVWVWPRGLDWLVLLGIGVVTQLAQVMMTRGIALVPVGPATAVGYVQIAFAAGWGILLFGEPLELLTAGGALLVVLAFGALLLGRGR